MNIEQKEKNWNKNPFFLRVIGMGTPYFVKTPWWMKMIYPHRVWNIATKEKIIYLTFDDGPHPVATPFVLDELKKYDAKATFFCIGKNVINHPAIYKRILEEGHCTGNHTQNHRNGWKTTNEAYLADIAEAAKHIESDLFRPPFGRINAFQSKRVGEVMKNKLARIVMWDILSGDFDEQITKDRCLQNVILNAEKGSIIVFHDSEKAFPLLEYCLPRVVEFFINKGFRFERLVNTSVKAGDSEKNLPVTI